MIKNSVFSPWFRTMDIVASQETILLLAAGVIQAHAMEVTTFNRYYFGRSSSCVRIKFTCLFFDITDYSGVIVVKELIRFSWEIISVIYLMLFVHFWYSCLLMLLLTPVLQRTHQWDLRIFERTLTPSLVVTIPMDLLSVLKIKQQ